MDSRVCLRSVGVCLLLVVLGTACTAPSRSWTANAEPKGRPERLADAAAEPCSDSGVPGGDVGGPPGGASKGEPLKLPGKSG